MSQNTQTVTRENAVGFLETALRNCPNVQFDDDDLEDVREALERFVRMQCHPAAQAPEPQGGEGFVWRVPVDGKMPELPDGKVYGWRTKGGAIYMGDGYPVPARKFALDSISCDAVLVITPPAATGDALSTAGEVVEALAVEVSDRIIMALDIGEDDPRLSKLIDWLRTRLSAHPTAAPEPDWREAEIERQEGLAKIYRQAQLTAEEKLCRAEASEKGWKGRAEYLERQLKNVLAGKGTTICQPISGDLSATSISTDAKPADTKAGHEAAPERREVEKLREALERLGSMEAFNNSRMVVKGQDDELIARIDFARAALNPSGAVPDGEGDGA